MFSGGRDSTLAAIRLAKEWEKLVLVTVTTEHLIGLGSVIKRLEELKLYLPDNTEWINVILPPNFGGQQLSTKTCLTCHQVYIVAGIIMADRYEASHIAFGYTKYQSNWPEQTPYAIENLTQILESIGIKTIFPVLNVISKEEAIKELNSYNLTKDALEQKCPKQGGKNNPHAPISHEELDRWGESLKSALAVRSIQKLNIAATYCLANIEVNKGVSIIGHLH